MGWYCPRCGHESAASGMCPTDGEVLARVSTHDLLGRKLGEYTVLAVLGGGSYGRVYRAVHERSGLLVAIKLLHQAIDAAESRRVMIEARAAAMLQHPNVAQVYDLGMTSDRRPYIVMQLLEGDPLSRLLSQPLAVPFVVSIAGDVLAALGVAHQRGVIHRDLKPDNIFVVPGGSRARAVIVDFGLAKLVADPRSPSLTATGEALGTPAYMAPEQVRGETCDGRADLYALGCVLFEALAGRPPFAGTATYAMFDAHLHTTPPRIRELRPDVPAAVEHAIETALAKVPGERFATAADMQRALVGSSTQRRRWPIALAIIAVLAVAGVATAAALAGRSDGDGSAAPIATTDAPPKPTPDRPLPPAPAPPPPIVDRPPPAPSPAPGPRRPIADADEPALLPEHQTALDQLGIALSAGAIKRDDLVRMRCAARGWEQPAGMVSREMRAFMRRYVALIDRSWPQDLDLATACAMTTVPSTKQLAHPFPKALPDELPTYEAFERAVAMMQDQLEGGRFTLEAARLVHCGQQRAAEQAIQQTGTETRQLRGMHRRIDILLEAYVPGSTRGPCP